MNSNDQIDSIEQRVIRQREALLTLTNEHVDCDQLTAAFGRITEAAATALRVPRASIWRYNDARTEIECLDLYDASTREHHSGTKLQAADFPNYFRVIAEAEIVAADDAIADARTSEFTAAYLRPFDIVSMMDAPIHRGGEVIGVLCHEQTGQCREWFDDEKAFAIATSTLVSLAFERCDRRRAESALELQSAALNAVAYPIVITDPRATIMWTNPAFTQQTGYTANEAAGRNSIELLNADRHDDSFFESMWQALSIGQVWRGEIWNRAKDGRVFLVDQTVTPVKDAAGRITHLVAIKIDLTTKKDLEAQFLQAQKMEVVGRLASGIAHDFNNLLTVIDGSAELALEDLAPDNPLRVDFGRILEAGTRASALTRQLLAFSRKQIANRAPLAVDGLLAGFSSMLQRLIGEDILLDVVADSGSGRVLADESQMEQLILNLAINARDAMPRGGVLRIAARAVDLDTAFVAKHVGARPGPHIQITVTDTGEGMAPEVLARVFEPFFTTKEQGKGTGLGLATVYAVVEQSRGTITVSSAVGIGTTFTINLPRVGEVAPAERADPPAPHGAAKVLIVDGDECIRELAVRILSAAGYTTLFAGDGASALRLIAARASAIDLVLTDAVLPDMSGRDLASRAALISPSVGILFTSGYTDDAVLAQGVRNNTTDFIAKPYTAPSLTAKVREVLERSRWEVSDELCIGSH